MPQPLDVVLFLRLIATPMSIASSATEIAQTITKQQRRFETPAVEGIALAAPLRRWAAAATDALILFAAHLLVLAPLAFFAPDQLTVRQVAAVVSPCAGWLYLWWGWARGQTPGQRAWKLRVIADDGEPMTAARALRRLLGYALICLTLKIGLLPILFDPLRRGWHDRIAGTLVVDARAPLPDRAVLREAFGQARQIEARARRARPLPVAPDFGVARRGWPLVFGAYLALSVALTWPGRARLAHRVGGRGRRFLGFRVEQLVLLARGCHGRAAAFDRPAVSGLSNAAVVPHHELVRLRFGVAALAFFFAGRDLQSAVFADARVVRLGVLLAGVRAHQGALGLVFGGAGFRVFALFYDARIGPRQPDFGADAASFRGPVLRRAEARTGALRVGARAWHWRWRACAIGSICCLAPSSRSRCGRASSGVCDARVNYSSGGARVWRWARCWSLALCCRRCWCRWPAKAGAPVT